MIRGPVLLGTNSPLLQEVRMLFHAARAGGEFERSRTEPTGAEWIVWYGGAVVEGFALVSYAGPGLAAVDCIYVLPSLRRRGMGKALVGAAEDVARDQGCSMLLMGLEKDAEPMLALTSGRGFSPSGVIVTKGLN
jgi:GNAT superfamily N-acetyltransferase